MDKRKESFLDNYFKDSEFTQEQWDMANICLFEDEETNMLYVDESMLSDLECEYMEDLSYLY